MHKKPLVFSKICLEDPSLQSILGYTMSNLPITYLRLPIIGKKKTHCHCWKLIQPIENMLSHWSGKCLSYGGGIQLVNWIIAGKYTNGPRSIHKRVKKLAYLFIWDGRRGIPLPLVVLPKEEGLVLMIATTAPNKKTANLQERTAILASWMQNRYIKGRYLQTIEVAPTRDSSQWKELMTSEAKTGSLIDCRAGNNAIWKLGNDKKTLGVIVECLRDRCLKDPQQRGYGLPCPLSSHLCFGE